MIIGVAPDKFRGQLLRGRDILVAKDIYRLGRDHEGIKVEWRDLGDVGVDLDVLDMTLIPTADKTDFEKMVIANLVFELLAYLGEKQ